VCERSTTPPHPTLPPYNILAPVRVREEYHSSTPHPSTIQHIGSGTCARGVLLLPTPPFHHTTYWLRYVCERSTTPPHPALPPYNILAPVRVREEYHSSPPRPSTIQHIGSGTCARGVLLLPTPLFHYTTYWLRYVCERSTTPPYPALPPCNTIGSGTCARGVLLLPTPPFHHKITAN
jgi:hypothetical protein